MVKSLIPVGKSLGPYIENKELKYFDHDLGPGLEELDVHQYATWWLSHNNPDAQWECRFDRAALKVEIDKENDSRFEDDMDRDINRLIELRAMVEIDLKNDPLEQFLSKHIFMPLGRCYGNGGDNPELYGIGHDEPHLWVPKWTQMIWASSHRDGPIWNACVEIATYGDNVTSGDVARVFVDALPALLAIHCGYLELK